MMIARQNIFEVFGALSRGEPVTWIAVAGIIGFISFCFAYKKITGKDLVESRSERRAARRKRKIVLWEYKGKS